MLYEDTDSRVATVHFYSTTWEFALIAATDSSCYGYPCSHELTRLLLILFRRRNPFILTEKSMNTLHKKSIRLYERQQTGLVEVQGRYWR